MNDEVHALRLSRIAHELRGSAGVALGATTELRGSLTPEGEKFVAMAQRGLERILRIADRLGRVSSLQRGLVEFRRENGDLAAFVRNEAQKSKELEHKTHIEVIVDVPTKPFDHGFDPEWLGFALRELVANAIQHARKRVQVSLNGAAELASVVIEDDGPGFRDDIDLELSASPNPRRGVGLSLPMCRCVIEDGHGGTLAVSNTEAGGARVELRFPRQQAIT